jgi:hypothetical protein
MARPAVATATAVSSMDGVNEYAAGPSAVHAVRKVSVFALSLLIVPLGLWDAPQVLLSRRVTAVQREDVQMYADPGQVADLLAAARANPIVAAAEPFLRRDLTITAAAARACAKGATSGQPDRCPASGRTHCAGSDH